MDRLPLDGGEHAAPPGDDRVSDAEAAKLLDRIVRASSTEGGLVVDPFCGSGTTLVAAAKLGRSFVGCDVGDLAIETAAARLRTQGAAFELRLPSEACEDPRTAASIRSS